MRSTPARQPVTPPLRKEGTENKAVLPSSQSPLSGRWRPTPFAGVPLGASNALHPCARRWPPPPLRYVGAIGKEKQTTISCGKCSAFQTTHTTCSIMVAGCLRFVKGEVNA